MYTAVQYLGVIENTVKGPSEIILICWFGAQEKCLINIEDNKFLIFIYF